MLFLENYAILLLLLIYIASYYIVIINRYFIMVFNQIPNPILKINNIFRKKPDTLQILGQVEKTLVTVSTDGWTVCGTAL